MDVVVQKRTIEDFEVFSAKYVQKVMAENAILEKLINSILQNDKTDEAFIRFVNKNAGDECLVRFDDGTYAWKLL